MNKISKQLLEAIYPIGSIYITVNPTSPNILFGGKWEQIKGRYLVGTGNPGQNSDNYFGAMYNDHYDIGVGTTGGQDSHQLTIPEMPSHNHPQSLAGDSNVPFNDGKAAYSWTIPTYRYDYIGSDLAQSVGENQYHNNMPPYFGVFIWKRIG